jgi:D-amino-acid oxidase
MVTVANLPTPDFAFDPDAPGACVAGVRPYRSGSYRLDAETASGKFIVHNYGHGGAGITLSWGCAAKVKDIVREYIAASHETEAAVLGAGVMGLTAARRLHDLGLKVTIYAERQPVETTSFRAGGQWAVSVVACLGKEQELAEIVRTAYTDFKELIGQAFGVSERPNYTRTPSENLEWVLVHAPHLLPDRVFLPRMPFEHHTHSGYKYGTLLVEPPIFLPRLEADLKARGVTFVRRKFGGSAEVLTSLTQPIVVNCTGLGAKTLWSDKQMIPIKGQLAMLPAQPALRYLYGQDGYMFPRADHVVIGGTYEEGVNDETPNKATCRMLVQHIASLFGKAAPVELPEIHIHHPRNAPMVNPAMACPVRPVPT